MPGNTDALQEFSEGRRMSSERGFFARNPNLVRAAKEHYGLSCQACGFTFSERYGAIGEGYIEVHHLNPLSERNETLWNEAVRTSIADVRIVCSNCHRMLHRRKPPLTVEALGEMLGGAVPEQFVRGA
jgi:5-methylcytosine-specific restriction protein A